MQRKRIGVMASGGGTDLQSVIDACERDWVQADVVAIASDVPGAGALGRAERHGIEHIAVPREGKGLGARQVQEEAFTSFLAGANVDLVVLAGYMRLASPEFVARWHGRLVNIHPALLPAFPGLDGQAQALAHGVRIAGATTHFVDEHVDHGPIILQAALPVGSGDDRDALATRILEVEHQILPRTVDLFCQGRLSVAGRQVRIEPGDSWQKMGRVLPGVLYSEGY